MRRQKQNFLNSVCPYRIMEERVTWGEFIATYIKAAIGAICFYFSYIGVVIFAECMGVID